ncbi:MAG: NIPSNAP family protein [Dehalococcoidia bacterium]|tara:strand:- start:1879 stop:2202 length:324 start_codon:yes stop_codon:yes gene_type:complete
MIYELRIYETIPGKLGDLNNRFSTHTVNLFKKHGIHVVGFWTEDIGTSNQLVYMLGFDSLADRETKWSNFQNDADWQRIRAESEIDGPINARVRNMILRPTDYSPMQ